MSPIQHQALRAAARHVVVAAGAGSGKTRVLVERYVHAITVERLRPERIIAITYTQKAAAEMRRRITDELTGQGLHEAAEALQRSHVSTIHAFCLRLLEENAIEAGLDPAFSVAAEERTLRWKDRVAEEVLGQAWAEDPGGMKALFDYAPPEEFKKELLALDACRRSRPAERPVGAVRPEPYIEALRHWIVSASGFLKKDFERFDFLEAPCAAFQTALANSSDAAPLNVARMAASAAATKLARVRKKEWAAEASALAEETRRIWAILADHAAFLRSGRIEALLDRFDRLYRETKRRHAAIDMDDQLLEVSRLVCKASFRERFARRYDLLMIDEFQDVNPLQGRILDELTGKLKTFTVGDVRQSIYGFRYADSRLFARKISDARATGHGAVEMNENYRSDAQLVGFVNRVFGSRPAVADMTFGELVPRRTGDPAAAPRIEIIRVRSDADTKDRLDDLRRREAGLLAERILEWTRVPGNTSEANPPDLRRFGEIALLFRTRSAMAIYEEALRRRGIPYQVPGGGSFYETLEVTDLLAALSALLFPGDDLKLASVLKSPVAGLSDDAMALLLSDRQSGLWDASDNLPALSELPAEDLKRWHRFMAWFRPLVSRRDTLTLAGLIRLITEESGYDRYLLTLSDGKRRVLNLERLAEKAREFEAAEKAGLSQFLSWMEYLRSEEMDDESQASFADSSGCVQLLTVHGSKGLEFPTVCLVDMGAEAARTRKSRRWMLTDANEVVCRAEKPEADLEKKWGLTRYAAAIESAARSADEEADRLFYVALTRARERLCLSGAHRPGSGDKIRSWMDQLLAVEPAWAEVDTDTEMQWEGIGMCLWCSPPAPDEGRKPGMGVAEDCANRLERFRKVCAEQDDRLGPLLQRRQTHERPYVQTVNLTVSDLLYSEPEDFGSADPKIGEDFECPSESTEEPFLSPSSYGDLFHAMLQRVDWMRPPHESIRQLLEQFGDRMEVATRSGLKSELESLFRQNWVKEIRAAQKKDRVCQRELPFLYRVANGVRELGYLKGQADLLYEAPDGRWVLVDYKTTRAENEHHHRQIRVYAFCLKALFGGKPERAFLYYSKAARAVEVSLEGLDTPDFRAELTRDYEQASLKAIGDSPYPQVKNSGQSLPIFV
ncbi:MAG: UvrD-helicase domain-containing protein [Candidatus Omnitrophica bacterium]|nr:UvrD-helicase domain-containing protein [Candidatus Omnitrophota bacterium]